VNILDEKWLMEQTAAEHFVAALNDLYATSYRILEHSDKPDIVIGDINTGRKIGIEVTHLFYNSEEAKALLGKSGNSPNGPEDIRSFIYRLNQLMEQKAQKAKGYNHQSELSLLIRVVSPVFSKDYFDKFERLIKVPRPEYNHIWLLFFNFENQKWDLIKTLK